MLKTIEVRWFGQHPVPTAVRAWFDRCPGEPERQPLRRDFYLHPIADNGLSVKLREGGIEIKRRQRSHGRVRLSGSLEGLVERWVKWRFPLQNQNSLLDNTIAGHGSWIAIDKERLLKRYLIGEDGVITPSNSQSTLNGDGQLELTSIPRGVLRWWTVGFEAAVDSEDALDHLLALTGITPEEETGRHLSIRNSFGYPQWLASLADT